MQTSRSRIPIRSSARTCTPRWSMAFRCSAGASAVSRPRRRCSASLFSMLTPRGRRVHLTGRLREGVTATDLVLMVTQMLRKQGVVGKFVEFFGPGLVEPVARDRATIGNMAPEYGATAASFRSTATRSIIGRHRARRCAGRAGRGLRQGTRPVPHPEHGRPGLHRRAHARSRRGRALVRWTEAAAGSRTLSEVKTGFLTRRHGVRQGRRRAASKRVTVEAPTMISATATS